ncbi:biogenesis of lysosome-related organelles complex 1 subunit 5 [Ischnura elegans]|uniref:biogenesis of lysosome-related organelles complex 1 subunit 5 n=1 Tax=Ischnura elegans TaxID=197161 RepID=UPI001ED87A04|nr:biogenesis of lysosome-related organelles complex 1 subunit 5 [Ischnura elegans]
MAAVVKDTGELWTRLFDHGPFLQGEIKYFLKEFEERRADREVEKIFQILERVTEIKETQIDRLKLSSDVHLPTLNANLEVAVGMCNRILEKEEEYCPDKALANNRERRKAEWESFVEDITQKCSKVEATFGEKEKEMREYYEQLGQKLQAE